MEDPANTTTRSDFHYDALGRRIGLQDQINGALSKDLRLVYCGSTLCAKEDLLTGSFTRYYGDGESRDGQARYTFRDHLGSVRAVSDSTGSLIAAFAYDPYGRRTVLSGAASDSDFGYTGHFTHPATGLALAPYRGYDANIGRWLSRDPIGEEGGINLYAYVGGNPVNLVDPLGLSGESQRYYLPNSPYIPGSPANKYWAKKLSELCDRMFSDKHPSTPTGQRGNELNVKPGTNSPTTIGDRDFTGHSLDRMQGRGVPPSAVEDAIQNGQSSPGNQPGTTVHAGDNGVTVVTGENGQVITVIPK